MLNRNVIKNFLEEELKGVRIPKNILTKDLVESFCQFTEDDYYEWLKDNFKTFFNHSNPDWKWIREKININRRKQ